MMNKRQVVVITLFILALLIFPGALLAAPIVGGGAEQAVLFSEEAVNLPGWVGGLLTLIALALPLAFRAWIRQK